MSKKTDLVGRLIEEVQPRHPIPSKTEEGRPLIEAGMVLVLMRHMTEKQAEASLVRLTASYEDWNELRVAQVQEIAQYLKPGGRLTIVTRRKNSDAARSLKDFLHEVFQKTHGLDLEFWREDPDAASKLVAEMPVLGMAGASYLLWIACDRGVAVTPVLIKLLDRLDLIKRTSSLNRGREMIQPLVPAESVLRFSVVLHEIAERWTDPDEPIFEVFPILQETAYGKKAYVDRQAHLARVEVQRQRAEERRRREDARERKRVEGEDKRKALIEAKRRAKVDAERKKREAREEAKRKAAAAKVAKEAARKAAAKKKELAKKAATKKAAAAKKAVAKKAAVKKAAVKKAAGKKQVATKKKAAPKTQPKKKVGGAKRPAAAKKVARKEPAKKKPAAKRPVKKAANKAGKKAAKRKKTGGRR